MIPVEVWAECPCGTVFPVIEDDTLDTGDASVGLGESWYCPGDPDDGETADHGAPVAFVAVMPWEFDCMVCFNRFVIEADEDFDPIETDPPCPVCRHNDGTCSVWNPDEEQKPEDFALANAQIAMFFRTGIAERGYLLVEEKDPPVPDDRTVQRFVALGLLKPSAKKGGAP